MKKGDCFHMPSPGNPIPHLWIVVSEIDSESRCAIVNVTTLGHICDKTVILHAGDHPSIDHDSIVRYQDAMITTERAIDAAIRGKAAFRKPPCEQELLKRIVAGIGLSKDTPIEVQVFCGFHVSSKFKTAPKNK